MHMLALEARSKILGERHLDTAQSHANLALVFVKSEEMDAAKGHFDRAIEAYEGNLTEASDDYKIVVANYSDVLNFIGEEKAAKALQKRAAKKLK